jgi:DNA-directed RNA polymerase subunit RPC12/RpoP
MNNAKLADAPFRLEFTTEKDPTVVEPVVKITSPPPNSEFFTGETITVSGTSTNLLEGTEVMVIIGGMGGTGNVKADGSWEMSVMAPDEAGIYDIEVNAGGWSDVIPVIIKQSEKTGDGDKDGDGDDFGIMGVLIPVIIIVIIVIIILLLLLRRKKSEPKVDEEVEESELEEGEEGEKMQKLEGSEESEATSSFGPSPKPGEQISEKEGEDEETFECPDCGDELSADATVCPTCGAEFEDDVEDEEAKEENEEVDESEAEEEGFECPDCGADLGADDTVCGKCGAEFED